MMLNDYPYVKDGVKSNKTSLNIPNPFHKQERNGSFETVLFNRQLTNIVHCPRDSKGEYLMPETVITIGIEAFSRCKGLTSIIISPSVRSIGCLAFDNCIRLTSITIPFSVEKIGYRVFSNCIGLRSIYVETESPIDLEEDSDVFFRVDKATCILYVPSGAKRKYRQAAQWKEFKQIVEMEPVLPVSSNN